MQPFRWTTARPPWGHDLPPMIQPNPHPTLFHPNLLNPPPPVRIPQYQVPPQPIITQRTPPKRKYRKRTKVINVDEIIQYYNTCKNMNQTMRKFDVSHCVLEKMINGTYGIRKRKTTPEEDARIYTLANNGLTSQQIADNLATTGTIVSHDTITRRLHEMKFSFVKPRIVQQLKPEQVIVRNTFANEMLKNAPDYFKRIVFSDESRFSASSDSPNLWRVKNDFSERTTTNRSKHPASTMCWGAIAYNFKSRLYFHHNGVDQNEYKKCLEETQIFGQLNNHFGEGQYVFQQDGATCHTTDIVMHYIQDRCRLLHGWPPNSPDLSPIEHIWAYMKRKLATKGPIHTRIELETALLQIWDDIPYH